MPEAVDEKRRSSQPKPRVSAHPTVPYLTLNTDVCLEHGLIDKEPGLDPLLAYARTHLDMLIEDVMEVIFGRPLRASDYDGQHLICNFQSTPGIELRIRDLARVLDAGHLTYGTAEAFKDALVSYQSAPEESLIARMTTPEGLSSIADDLERRAKKKGRWRRLH